MTRGLRYSKLEKSTSTDCSKPWNSSSGACVSRGEGRTCTLAAGNSASVRLLLEGGGLITSGIKAGYETITEEERQTYFNETDYSVVSAVVSLNMGNTIVSSYDREITLPHPLFDGKPLNYRIESAYNRDAFLIQWFQKHPEPAVQGDDLGCPVSPIYKIEWTMGPTLPPSEPTGDADADTDADTDAVTVTVDENPEEGTVTRTVRPAPALKSVGHKEKKITAIPFYKNWKIIVPAIVLIIMLIVIIVVMKKKPKPLQVAQWGRRY